MNKRHNQWSLAMSLFIGSASPQPELRVSSSPYQRRRLNVEDIVGGLGIVQPGGNLFFA